MVGDEFFQETGMTHKDQVQRGDFGQACNTGRNNAVGTEVPTHCIDSDDWN
ncbi:hypothetical protein GCM10009304_15440 [Pseudomonas matsuisoli]|uniref:Uncharacterized protein n=1 Tax=Pseudomonas matsuisoli TaxID=1515666 RepID=A0A917PTK2_9PSED|nr:hypothetical protein GCM10009304_15440 [Pseudomonas matsuisoli]